MDDRRIIVALDGMSDGEAADLLSLLGEAVKFYKIGLELFTHYGPKLVDTVRVAGREVFLDLKFHDIPATVAGAVRSACTLGPALLTVHASGGRTMIRAAADARGGSTTKILAVTVLTSSGEDGAASRVLDLAREAREAGADGVVASAREARALKEELGADFLVVTPGIRPAGSSRDDQARVATPAEAIAAGSDFLVIGRPITRAPDPRAAVEAIRKEIEAGGSGR